MDALQKIDNIQQFVKVPTHLTLGDAKRGRRLCEQYPILRDLAVFMENPENRVFIHRYMNSVENFQRMVHLMKLYETIDLAFEKRGLGDAWAWHKIFALYNLWRDPEMRRLFITRPGQAGGAIVPPDFKYSASLTL